MILSKGTVNMIWTWNSSRLATEDLTKLRRIAQVRDKWKELSKNDLRVPVILHYDIVEGNSKHDLDMKQFKNY